MKTRLFGILLILLCNGCEKIQTYPPEPKLSLIKYEVKKATDEFGNKIVKFSCSYDFIDGDGDMIVQLSKLDSSNAIYSRQFMLLYEKDNGIYRTLSNPDLDTIIYIFPYADFMSREGQNKTLKGTILHNYNFTDINKYSDTIKIEIFLFDKALHKSNVLEFPDIALK